MAVWHELVHFRDFRMRVVELGPAAGFRAYSAWGSAAREQSVYEVLNGGRHWDMLNAAEQEHAIRQVSKRGIRP
jgi:thioesterase domain-containing protein